MYLTDTPSLGSAADRRIVEDAAIAFVLEQEAVEGRLARDVRGTRALGDVVSGERIVEVRVFATPVRGQDVWLEPHLYETARAHPDRFWFYVVEDLGSDVARFRLLRLGGEPLQRMLEQAIKRRYYAVPVPATFQEDEDAAGIEDDDGAAAAS
ncbi:hypothetical protein [Trujillonella endophytica]|uniref:Protein NO VEIN C-terminal domain-containing protein n=1 Tax=Trujillonella endophytica TaxID=673521 RepID=A0A1H8VWE1_9ACTN|nr:hypothetical protein [Trujillella endophytica]SEP19268.1 hypothetical protein SAMN05660991_03799 [Trujillella endophytica]